MHTLLLSKDALFYALFSIFFNIELIALKNAFALNGSTCNCGMW
ncbi:hypothetical protein HMPREF9371_2205 [Neisseria shayeganii 871]|uniref:Uncharacterized protein n=1 Tax=Neisseria shayeganii 871 TaxID=1032488 RepID=G4CKR5_9NEIS|nr:hypothetical protein HMPREF9371_2205 [Neisseria shayeganii 871]